MFNNHHISTEWETTPFFLLFFWVLCYNG
jgi:hypothetical protein